MFCPNCGTESPDSAAFCTQCGYNLANAHELLEAQKSFQAAEEEPALEQNNNASSPINHPSLNTAPNFAYDSSEVQQPTNPPSSGIQAAKVAIPVALMCIAALAAFVLIMPSGGGGAAGDGTSEGLVGAAPVGIENTDAVSSTVSAPDGTPVTALARPSFITADMAATAQSFTPQVSPYTVESDLSNVINKSDFVSENYSRVDTEALARNGFWISVTNDYLSNCEFFNIYETNRYSFVPNFVTTDSMMHTYHLYFMHLLKNTERGFLSSSLLEVSKLMLEESLAQLEQVRGSEWETAALRNVAFFAVGTSLLDEGATPPAEVASQVNEELAKIKAGSAIETCSITATLEDYSQYTPRGYYAGDESLEKYFRAMMWYGRINFTQKEEELDRSAALMTLALNGQANTKWEAIYSVTSFFAGASDDCGYYEYMPIITSTWGNSANAQDLANNAEAWQNYHAMTALMPAPKINSVVVQDTGTATDHEEEEKGFRFMGQRFSMDAVMFQNLVYNIVGENTAGQKRMLPNALDIPAAMGSQEALNILDGMGETAYANYSTNMTKLQEAVDNTTAETWNASLSSQWLYTLRPLLAEKGEGWPSFMQSKEWTRKSIQTYLGSYTELKHDTVLYAKQVMVEMGGAGPEQKDDRGYVEPEPDLYSRLSILTKATSAGLSRYGLLGETDASNLQILQELADQLYNISLKELNNETLSDAEYELIRSYGGQIEHFWEEVYREESTASYMMSRDFPAALVTDVATNADGGTVLELGTGSPSVIYAIVPVDGSLRIAVGSCFCFYQFEHPLSDRLTDTKWREMMGFESTGNNAAVDTPAKEIEGWTTGFQSKLY